MSNFEQIIQKSKELFKKSKKKGKEMGALVCKVDDKLIWEKEIEGSAKYIKYPKGWHSCKKGKPAGTVHTHWYTGVSFSFEDIAYLGQMLRKFDNYFICTISKNYMPKMRCLFPKVSAKEAETYFQFENRAKEEYLITPEVRYIDKLASEGKIKEVKIVFWDKI